jgi:hypothetical protein
MGTSVSPTATTPRPRWLPVARLAWVAVAVVALGSFAISVPARYAELVHPTAGVRAALAELGLSAGGYALYNVALDTVFVSAFAAVSLVIFWRRSYDPVALLVATMLVLWGPLNGLFVLTPSATEGKYGLLQTVLGLTLTYIGYITWMLFFYLFPSGRFVPRWTRWLALLYGVAFFGLWTFTRPDLLADPPLRRGRTLGVGQLSGGPGLPLRASLGPDRAPADQVGGLRGGRSDNWRPDDYGYHRGGRRPSAP